MRHSPPDAHTLHTHTHTHTNKILHTRIFNLTKSQIYHYHTCKYLTHSNLHSHIHMYNSLTHTYTQLTNTQHAHSRIIFIINNMNSVNEMKIHNPNPRRPSSSDIPLLIRPPSQKLDPTPTPPPSTTSVEGPGVKNF